MFLLLDALNLGGAEKAKLMECVDSNGVSTAGPFVPEFEQWFARYLGTEECVSVQSGTAALHIALAEAGDWGTSSAARAFLCRIGQPGPVYRGNSCAC